MTCRLFGLLLLCGMETAGAGSLYLNPVRLSLSADHAVEVVTISNQGAEPSVVQLETMAWTKTAGGDVYSPTTDLIAAPPIFTLPPGGSQIVRIGLRNALDPRSELNYRVYFQEVPPPPKPGFQGLNVALRLGVPVYVTPVSDAGSQ